MQDDTDPGFADRWLSAEDRDDAAGDRADARDDRAAALSDREHATQERIQAGSAAVSAPAASHDHHELLDELDRRGAIWRSQGLLMARLGVSANEAFHLMMLASQRRQITLAAVAQDFDQSVERHRGQDRG